METTLTSYSEITSMTIDLPLDRAMRGMWGMLWAIAQGQNSARVYWVEVQ